MYQLLMAFVLLMFAAPAPDAPEMCGNYSWNCGHPDYHEIGGPIGTSFPDPFPFHGSTCKICTPDKWGCHDWGCSQTEDEDGEAPYLALLDAAAEGDLVSRLRSRVG